MIRQIVFVSLNDVTSDDNRTKAIEAACNWDWLAEYRLVDTSLFSNLNESVGTEQAKTPSFDYYLFFEKDYATAPVGNPARPLAGRLG